MTHAHADSDTSNLAHEADQDRLEGTITCTVKGATAIEIDEGISTTYKSFTDLPNAEESIQLSYAAQNLAGFDETSIRISLHKDNDGESDTLFGVYVYGNDDTLDKDSDVIKFDNEGRYGTYLTMNDNTVIRASIGDEYLVMTRYYKADWQGIYTQTGIGSEYTYSMTFDCQQSTDELSHFIRWSVDAL
jgi:hypothetical protein